MVVLGLLLIALGVLVVVAAVFDLERVPVELLGTDLDSLHLFLLGVGAGLAVLWGFSILKFGTRRTLQRRREAKQLNELSQKLDRAEAERRETGHHEAEPRETGHRDTGHRDTGHRDTGGRREDGEKPPS